MRKKGDYIGLCYTQHLTEDKYNEIHSINIISETNFNQGGTRKVVFTRPILILNLMARCRLYARHNVPPPPPRPTTTTADMGGIFVVNFGDSRISFNQAGLQNPFGLV